ncbi:MAG: bifunctional adenosylcobinamide hydrolase/alpha-ribazole phosphatase CbiS [Pyrobaculum sp.]
MEVQVGDGFVAVDLGGSYRVLSTLPTPEAVSKVLFIQVGRDFSGDYMQVAEEARRKYGGEAAVFLTAADLRRAFRRVAEGGVAVFGSVALSPPTCMGTANLAVFADSPLSRWGLADLMRTVVEAKALAAVDRLLRCNRRRSPGTVTDAVLVGVPLHYPEEQHFAGPATEVGKRAADLVYRLVVDADDYDLFERALGASREEFAKAFEALLREAPLSAGPGDALRQLEEFLRDPNVWALIIAASELDALGYAGGIPGLSAEEFAADTPRIVADELLGVALADYLGGFNTVLTLYWVERVKKKGAFRELGPFTDDVFSALLAAAYLQLYKKTTGGGT